MKSVSIIGCGYVGLCLAVVLSCRNFKVIAGDIDKEKILKIKNGNSPFYESNLDKLLNIALKKGIEFTNDVNYAIKNSEITFVTVGTPPKEDGSANLQYLESAIRTIAQNLRDKGDFHSVVIKSTVVPTTTNQLVKPILEEISKKKVGIDVGLVMNPEFLREGSAIHDTENPHLIVIGANDEKSSKILECYYQEVYQKENPEVIKTNIETAELIKYANNAFLATKISFINTIANICQRIPGTDVGIISRAIGKDPRISSLFLNAGPGYGGSCFPKDVSALINFSKKIGYEPLLISATHQVNITQAQKVMDLIKKNLGELDGKKISVLGLAFKSNTDDIRESVSTRLINLLLKENSKIFAHDPMAIENSKRIFQNKVTFYENIDDCVKESDCCVIMTDWDEYKKISKNTFVTMKHKLVIDARRILNHELFDDSIKLITLGSNP